jgi:pyruvate/2-oxoglutarate dehydrogenase complex dihydrolipoamide acyltransferase (E2) component
MKSEGIAVSVNDFVIKAVATALRQYPAMNCIWNGEQVIYIPLLFVSYPKGIIFV